MFCIISEWVDLLYWCGKDNSCNNHDVYHCRMSILETFIISNRAIIQYFILKLKECKTNGPCANFFFSGVYIQSVKRASNGLCNLSHVFCIIFRLRIDRIAADAKNNLKASFNIAKKHLWFNMHHFMHKKVQFAYQF